MKKLLKMGIAAALACMFCFALVGCGGFSTTTIDGNWEVSGGTAIDSETLELMKSLDMNLILVVNTDGTFSFDMYGYSVSDGKWTDNGDGKYSFTFAETGEYADMANFEATISGDKLTINIEDGDSYEMKKGGDDLKTTLESDRIEAASLEDDTTTE